MTQSLATGTRNTIDLATGFEIIIHFQFLDNSDSGTLDAGLTDHCAIL